MTISLEKFRKSGMNYIYSLTTDDLLVLVTRMTQANCSTWNKALMLYYCIQHSKYIENTIKEIENKSYPTQRDIMSVQLNNTLNVLSDDDYAYVVNAAVTLLGNKLLQMH